MLNTIFISKKGGGCADEYIGTSGDIFYDPDCSVGLRISDGKTAGGMPMYTKIPVGAIIVAHNDSTIPGFLKLDGTKYPPEDYPQLVEVGYPVVQSLLGGSECSYAADDVGISMWGMQMRILKKSQINAVWMGWADGGRTLLEWDNSTINSTGDFSLSAYNIEFGYAEQNLANYCPQVKWALESVDKTTGAVTVLDERSLVPNTELIPFQEKEFILTTPVNITNSTVRIRTVSTNTWCCISQVRFFTGGTLADTIKLPEGRSEVFTTSSPGNGVYGDGLAADYQAFIRI
jgi:hypothetical protein